MNEEFEVTQANGGVMRTRLHGVELLLNSRLNKGTAFTEEERDAFWPASACCRPTLGAWKTSGSGAKGCWTAATRHF